MLDATRYGATPQRGQSPDVTLIPEPSVAGSSTLNVNVFTPTEALSSGDGAALPVLVYIHGGGFVSGSPASPWYDGAAFARDGVVTVVVSYRLGFEGFGHIVGAPDNRGILDWLLALEWVRDTIAVFGGDPERVTIAGQSAGGGAVLTLLGMPAAAGLFSKVWAISAALADIPLAQAEEFAERVAAQAGVEPTIAGFGSLSEQQLTDAHVASAPGAPGSSVGGPLDTLRVLVVDGLSLGPVIDGHLVPLPTLESLRAGVGAEVPLVLGTADDEFSMILLGAVDALSAVTPEQSLADLGFDGERRVAYLEANATIAAAGTAPLLGRFLTDTVFRSTALAVAESRESAAEGDSLTWLYRFSWRSSVFGLAIHCLDVPFFFDCLSLDGVTAIAGEAPPQSLADDVHAAAVGFVALGNPGWTTVDGTGSARIFDLPVSIAPDAYKEVRALIAE